MTYYIDIHENGTLVISLIETLINRKYGKEKQYVKYRMTDSYLWDNHYVEERVITSGTWDWATMKYNYLGKKDI